jgi:hypothetical protein
MRAHSKKRKGQTEELRAAAGYIGSMSRELALIARTDGCETLSYLLELAAIEADTIIGVPEGYRLS